MFKICKISLRSFTLGFEILRSICKHDNKNDDLRFKNDDMDFEIFLSIYNILYHDFIAAKQ